MIRSMTGYGEAERVIPAGRLRAELKSVNHRHFSANLRLPQAVDRLEAQIRDWLRAHITRGHVNFSLRLDPPESEGTGAALPSLQLDEARARQYHRLLTALKERLGLPGEVDVALLSRFSDMIVRGDDAVIEIDPEDVRGVVDEAARSAVRLRLDEGKRLVADLEGRLDAIAAELAVIEERAPARLVAERDRLRQAVRELTDGLEVDEDRLAREIAFMAERWDISEELVRLRSHMELFRELIASDDAEPVGKRMGFLVQEMHREANTIASKANDAVIEHRVIAIKTEIERLREQVENVE